MFQNADIFCDPLQENEFDIEVSDSNNNLIDPPGQFEGSTDGTMIMKLEPGTYNIQEIKHAIGFNQLLELEDATISCRNNGFVGGGDFFDQTSGILYAEICFEYEDEEGNDCSLIDLKAGDDKTCTVKNYIAEGANVE